MSDRSDESRVLELVTVTGTGSVTTGLSSPNGPVTGMRGFAAIASIATGDTFDYFLEAVDSFGQRTGAYEEGTGTWLGAGQFARTTVWRSSNSNAAVNFGAGTKVCGIGISGRTWNLTRQGAQRWRQSIYRAGTVASNAVVFRAPVDEALAIVANFAGSQARAETAPTANATLLVYGGASGTTQIGTITFSAGQTSGTFATTSGTAKTLDAADILRIVGPSSADATLAGVSITLVGWRNNDPQNLRFYAQANFATVAAMVASTLPAMGSGTLWVADGYRYREADAAATDHHVTTAGGVKLYVQPVNGAQPAGAWPAKPADTTTYLWGPNFVADGTALVNFPADDNQRVIGQEYLAAFHKRAVEGSQFRVMVWGDSRPAGNSQTGNFIWHQALKQAARRRGYLRGEFLNNAVGGSTVLDWTNTYVDTHLDGTDDPHLVVLCVGINDLYIPNGAATPATVVNRMDALLQKIRVTKGYALASLSIAVVVPVSCYNPTDGRDPRYIEPLRAGLRRLARKHQVCVVDGYAVGADARNQRGLGFAADITAPETIHQNNIGMVPILAQLIDAVLPDMSPMMGGGLAIESGGGASFTASQLPADYPVGMSLFRATPGGGGSNWPLDGFVHTLNFPDDIQVQWNYATASSDGAMWVRKGRSNAWGSWAQVSTGSNATGADVTPATGYSLPGGGENMRTALSAGLVVCDGYVTKTSPGTIAADTVIATIASGQRPARTLWGVPMAAWSGSAWEFPRGRINTDGTVQLMQAVTLTATRVYLNSGAWSIA